MDYPITRDFLNKARKYIKEHEPYAEDDPIWDVYDGKDPERCRSGLLVILLEKLGFDPYDDNDYGDITD